MNTILEHFYGFLKKFPHFNVLISVYLQLRKFVKDINFRDFSIVFSINKIELIKQQNTHIIRTKLNSNE